MTQEMRSFASRRQSQIGTVFVHYTKKTKLSIKEDWDLRKKFDEWLMKHTDYRIEFGTLDGTRLGVYLEPADALAFRLTFGLDE